MTALALARRNTSVGLPNMDASMTPSSTSPFLRPMNTTSPTVPTGTGSLYHLCRSVLDRLSSIEGMTDYIEAENSTTDPLTKLTHICRQGYPLCTLYNALQPFKPISVDIDPNLNALNLCKANVYHFIVACKNNLLFHEDDMFTISDLFQNDTNGFVKVVNTINKILQLLENRGIIKTCSSNRNSENADPNTPKNTRDKVVLELLETERKYLQDMEILQNYMRELQLQKIVSPDTIHYLFGNLNPLVDFQRRFLIQLEEMAEKSPQEQRIGSLFIQAEKAFSVYEPYCTNYFSAQDLVVQETSRLQKLADILDPTYQLPSMLIKPIQRICKYPLLLNELAKSTDKDWPFYEEMLVALEATKRVAGKVNETQRQQENVKAVQDLKKRLDDGKGLPLDGCGNLLLQDKLTISILSDTSNHERDLHVFLFDKALLICKESKGSNLLPKSNTLSKKKRRGSLVPKMLCRTVAITIMGQQAKNGVWSLYADLKDSDVGQIAFRFRHEEKSTLWASTLSKAIQKSMEELDLPNQPAYTECDLEYDFSSEFFDDEEDDYAVQQKLRNHRTKLGPIQLNGRSPLNVPGMNLSPLPRSQSSMTTNSIASTPPHYHMYYPATPPASYPSSPTTSAVVTNTEELYENQQHYYQDSLMNSGRSKSQSAALEGRQGSTRNPLAPNRLRSQSSPNIMKNSHPVVMTASHSNTTCEMRTKVDQVEADTMKIKLIFNDGIYAITTHQDISYVDLMEKVDKKIRVVTHMKSNDVLRLKYQDEDGDFITINSDDDVPLAFESRGLNNTAIIFVSL